MFTKPVSSLNQADIGAVIGVEESERIEFKRDAYGRTDDDVREMLRDLASMANASGGYLLVGVDTDAEERAIALPGIQDAGDEANRMLSSFRVNLSEQILGLDFGVVEVAQGRHVIVWSVPRSTRAPHLITYRGLNQFWRRHGRQKDKMTIEEIRSACVRIENIRENLESFIDKSHIEQLSAVAIDRPALLMAATPLLVREEVLDIFDTRVRDLVQNPPYLRHGGFMIVRHESPRPSIYGLRAERGENTTEVFRNGHVRCSVGARSRDPDNPKAVNPYFLAETLVSFFTLADAIARHVGLLEPIVVRASLANIPGWTLEGDSLLRGTWKERRHLELAPMQVPYPMDPFATARLVADRFWNAFGLDRCPLFDAKGRYDSTVKIRSLF